MLNWDYPPGRFFYYYYHPYGKLVKFFCRRSEIDLKKRINFPIILITLRVAIEKNWLSNPVCGKLFRKAQSLKDHLENSKNNDLHHNLFLENKFKDEFCHKLQKKSDHDRRNNILKFEKINLRKV